MKFTFGIITTGLADNNLETILKSIEDEVPIDCYEIIIVGNSKITGNNISIIPFEENIVQSWITRKKNLITQNSKFENIVFMHDYVKLNSGWYNGFLQFGNNWDVCMNQVFNLDGSRFIDWMGLPDDPEYGNVLLPYDYPGSEGMYISGTYFVAKRIIMQQYPLNENLKWGEGEDIEWSKRILGGFIPIWLKNRNMVIAKKVAKYKMNTFSSVQFLKQKHMSSDHKTTYDLHSGNEARPLPSTIDNYPFLKHRQK